MKKLLMIFIVLALLLNSYTVFAEEADGAVEETEETNVLEDGELPPLYYDYEELIIGNTMPTSGAFFTEMWGNNTSDVDVRDLLHAYNLVEWDAEFGGFQLDESVVSGSVVTANEEGDHTYNLFLYDDLYYSDGTPITAWDYAFSFLLRIAPQIEELGGTPVEADYLLGYHDYVTGEVPYLAGVRVVDDHQMLITINHEFLPFFFEVALLDCNPYPNSAIAPNNQVADDGNGIYFRTPLNAAELARNILDENSGYLSHPAVVSGPYRLTSYDGQTASFERNPYYKGNSQGALPLIERLIYKTANPQTMIDELMRGEYGLLNKMTNASIIAEGLGSLAQDTRFNTTPYQRSGLSFIIFNTEKKTVSSAAVRKAIAYCLDKDGLVEDYVGNYGLRVDGYYGMGQWMYQLLNQTIAYPVEVPEENTALAQQEYDDAIEAWEGLTQRLEGMFIYEQDIDAAVALLEADGWTLNQDGNAYNAAANDVRCKRIDGELVALNLKLMYASSSSIGNFLEERLVQPLAVAGIRLSVEQNPNLLSVYYHPEEQACDMLFLATNFDVNFDPTAAFEPGNANNHTRINDEQLYELAVDMRRTEPGDLLTYCEKWLDFQDRFNETLPMIPVYSNVYFDFYASVLHDYTISENTTWGKAIIGAYMSDEVLEEELEDELMDEDTMIFGD